MPTRTETLTDRADPRTTLRTLGAAPTSTHAGAHATRWWPGRAQRGTRREIGRNPGIDLRQGTIGRFAVREELGNGAFGAVYRAFDPDLRREVALKVLHGARGDHRGRVLAEARALARVNHPNVVSVYEVGEVDSIIYLAMELVEGQTLNEWAGAQQPQGRRFVELLRVFDQMLLGLDAAHREGLVHRDVKPSNVLISKTGRVVVLDFGLARPVAEPSFASPAPNAQQTPIVQGGSEVSCVAGTPVYMSPEQHLGHRLDARSDQFSCVVTMWELLYGQRPFRADDYAGQVDAVTHHRVVDPPPRRGASKRFQQVLRRALRVEPADRFEDLLSLREALLRAINVRLKTREILRVGFTLLALAGGITVAGAQLLESSTRMLTTMAGVSILLLLTAIGLGKIPARSVTMRWIFPFANGLSPALLFSALVVDADYVSACASWFPPILMLGILANVVNIREPRRVWVVALISATTVLVASIILRPPEVDALPHFATTPSMLLRLCGTLLVASILARLASLSQLNPGMLVGSQHAPPVDLREGSRGVTRRNARESRRGMSLIESAPLGGAGLAVQGEAQWSIADGLSSDAPFVTESFSKPWRRA